MSQEIVAFTGMAVTVYICTVLWLLVRRSKGPPSNAKRSFSTLLLLTGAWSILHGVSSTAVSSTEDMQLLLVKFALLAALLQSAQFMHFAFSLREASINYKKPVIILLIFVSFSILSNYSVTETTINGGRVDITGVGPAMAVFTVTILTFTTLAAKSFYFLLRQENYLVKKKQVKQIFLGFFLSTSLVLSTILLPLLLERDNSLILLAPFYFLAFLIPASMATLRYGLFEFSRAFLRALTYASIISLFATTYLVCLVLIVLTISDQNSIMLGAAVSLVCLGLLVAMSLRPLKRLFDVASNRLFFRAGYDPQLELTRLSTVYANEYRIKEIAFASRKRIISTVRPKFLTIDVVNQNEKTLFRTGNDQISTHQLSELLVHTKDSKEIVELRKARSSLGRLMRSADIELLVPLVSNSNRIGTMFLGPKQTGSGYSAQDMKFIKILSKSMALALQNARHYEEIKQFADKLQDEVNTATENLRKTNKKLRALNKSKDEFLSMTSHQLRPQLTAARGFISMIGMEETTKQERSELVELSGRSMDRMARVLSDLLNMTRLEDGKFKIYREKTNLVELITSEVDGFRTAASKKNIELNVITKRKKIDLEIDWVKIREVVFNFIDNAIQYSPDDGIVAVRILASSQEVEMMVEDQGIGVSEKDQKKLFSKFYRGQNAEELRPSGTGIGLFVAKEVIEAHKGEIVFKSEEGKGSTFGFRLPRNARK